MYKIYVDDERTPVNKYDKVCRTYKDGIAAFRQAYRAGHRHFFLELDHDDGQNPDKPFINILKDIETYVHLGKMKDLDIDIHIHSGNVVGRQNMESIIRANDYMYEVM